MANLLWTVIVVLFVMWALGLVFSIGGGMIHALLVVAAVLVVFNLLTRGRAAL
jgi:hypothetical protein